MENLSTYLMKKLRFIKADANIVKDVRASLIVIERKRACERERNKNIVTDLNTYNH